MIKVIKMIKSENYSPNKNSHPRKVAVLFLSACLYFVATKKRSKHSMPATYGTIE